MNCLYQPPRQHSYENASLPIAFAQTISQPYVVARADALSLTGRERVLEVAAAVESGRHIVAIMSTGIHHGKAETIAG